jgi:phosphoglycolate phosphatase-like HAD superfamily hydrolase
MAAAGKDLWALDFDGVICDSCGESSQSAWRVRCRATPRRAPPRAAHPPRTRRAPAAASRDQPSTSQAAEALWPELFTTPAALARRDAVLAAMRVVRPVVETGYENLVQVRCLLEGACSPEEMLETWHELLPERMAAWGLERAALVELFGATRDAWMAEDLAGWLAPNEIYPGAADAVRALMAAHEVHVVTTKQARFTEALLREKAGIPFPPERIFSQTASGRPKSEVLAALRAAHPGGAAHFVEDKMSTLEKVAATPGFEEWRLYLVDWGYNTPAERARAAASGGRIEVVSAARWAELAAAG